MASLSFFRSLLKGRERAAAAATALLIVAVGWLWPRPVEPSRDPAGIPQLEEVARLEAPTVIPLRFPGVRAVAWSPNGKRIAALHSVGSGISVWEDGKLLPTIKRAETTGGALSPSLLFLSDNRTLLAPAPTDGDNKKAYFGLWNSDTGELERLISGPSSEDPSRRDNTAAEFVISPDGRHVAMTPRFGGDGVILLETSTWRTVAHRQFYDEDTLLRSSKFGFLPHFLLPVRALAFADNQTLFIGTMRGLFTLRIPTLDIVSHITDVNKVLIQYEHPMSSDDDIGKFFIINLAVSPDGEKMLVGRSTVLHHEWQEISDASNKQDATAFAKVAPGRIWDLRATREGPYIPELREVIRLTWSPNGRQFAALTEPSRVHVYDFQDERPHLAGFVSLISSAITVAFSPDSKHLAVGDQQFVRIFKTR